MQTTFYNPPSSNADQFKTDSVTHLNSCQDDIQAYMSMADPYEGDEDKDLSPWDEYGLCFDSVENDETGDIEYFRYQISWGGPSEEYRFYRDGRIEFVFMDWFCGIGFDVTDTLQAEWLLEMLDVEELLNTV